MDDLKKLRLVPESPYFNHVKVGVYDENAGEWRKRCMIDVEYGDSDIAQIIRQLGEKGKIEIPNGDCMPSQCSVAVFPDAEKAHVTDEILAHYKDWMYDLIKRLISSDWVAESGEDEVLAIVREHL